MSTPHVVEGHLSAKGRRFALIAGRFNSFIVDQLVSGAIDTLVRHGADAADIVVYKVPGGWELPVVAEKVAARGGVDAIIALGAVIRGATPHFDYVCSHAAAGIGRVGLDTGVPCIFGVLTTDTIEQAIERAGTKAGNKGGEAAAAAIEMADLFARLDASAGGETGA